VARAWARARVRDDFALALACGYRAKSPGTIAHGTRHSTYRSGSRSGACTRLLAQTPRSSWQDAACKNDVKRDSAFRSSTASRFLRLLCSITDRRFLLSHLPKAFGDGLVLVLSPRLLAGIRRFMDIDGPARGLQFVAGADSGLAIVTRLARNRLCPAGKFDRG